MNAEPPVGEKPDYVEAAKWFRKAGDLGVRDSQFNLAILYARGLGVEQDLRQSWLWFSLAAQQGDADAAKKRDEVAAKMDFGLARRGGGRASEIQAGQARSGGERSRRPAGRLGRQARLVPLSQSPPAPGRPLAHNRLFDRNVAGRRPCLAVPAFPS